jgi:hypothetical protein
MTGSPGSRKNNDGKENFNYFTWFKFWRSIRSYKNL